MSGASSSSFDAGGLGEAEFLAALQALLPRGAAWPRDPGAAATRFLSAIAARMAALHARGVDLLERESDPAQAVELLAEWEASYGLPDPCVGEAQTIEQRRAALLSRIAEIGGQSRAYFRAVAATLGYEVTIEECRPFRIGASVVGEGLHGEDWIFTWRMRAPAVTVRAFGIGQSGVGEPLRAWGNEALECVMSRIRPAHTTLLYAYDES